MNRQFVILILFFISCNEPNEHTEPPYSQVNIPWSTILNSPWPVENHDFQNTNRSQYAGPKSTPTLEIYDINLGRYTPFTLDNSGNVYFSRASNLFRVNTNDISVDTLYDIPNPSWSYPSTLILENNLALFFHWNGWIYFYDYINDTLSHSVQIDDNIWASSIVDLNNEIWVPCDNKLVKISMAGTEILTLEIPNIMGGGISPDGETVYFSNSDYLYAIHNETGEILNTYSGRIHTHPTISNEGNLFVIDRNDTSFTSLDSELNILWKYSYGQKGGQYLPAEPGAIDYNGNYYTTGSIQDVQYLLSIGFEGELNWEVEVNHSIYAGPVIDINNNIYVTGRGRTSDDGWGGYLSCYNDGGILQWKVELDYYYFNLAIIIMPNGSIIISNREDFHVVG
jgi:hypothetical protein